MTTQNNSSTTPAAIAKTHSTEGRREKCGLAERLTEQLAILLEHDDEGIGKLLLLIDLFEENCDDATLIESLAGYARARAFGMSDKAERLSHEYVRSLRASPLANLSSIQEERESPASEEDDDTQTVGVSAQREYASLQEEKEQPTTKKTDAPQPGSFSAQRERVRHLARKIAEIGAQKADALFELLAYIEPEGLPGGDRDLTPQVVRDYVRESYGLTWSPAFISLDQPTRGSDVFGALLEG